ncbi:MAG: hypothetical protein CMH30_01485 [Micavibrio sp.]|nr:hypothetical protein [Micavibrio sp.]|tara:strand:- start:3830 stop:4372 length:543 start_codon:yes stop_codon:yes gene_type:complete
MGDINMVYKSLAMGAFAFVTALSSQAQQSETLSDISPDPSYFMLQGSPNPVKSYNSEKSPQMVFDKVAPIDANRPVVSYDPSINLPINLQEGLYYRIQPKTDEQRDLEEQRTRRETRKTGWAQIGETLIDEGTVGYKFENGIFLEVDQMDINTSTGDREIDRMTSKHKSDFWGLRLTYVQ